VFYRKILEKTKPGDAEKKRQGSPS
jgi:hypothetical protein